jgi:hypothetical protein
MYSVMYNGNLHEVRYETRSSAVCRLGYYRAGTGEASLYEMIPVLVDDGRE